MCRNVVGRGDCLSLAVAIIVMTFSEFSFRRESSDTMRIPNYFWHCLCNNLFNYKKTDCENCIEILFPAKSCSAKASGILLASRMIFGGLLFSHGIAKWSNFDTMSTMFPDPLGIGSSASLSLAIFGEVICSLGFIVGAFYRLALIPMIFTMCIAFSLFTAQIRLR